MRTSAKPIPLRRNLTDTLTAVGEPLLFGLRLWASVCLALYVAFWLELDNPFWAGTSPRRSCASRSSGPRCVRGWFRTTPWLAPR